MESYQSHLPSKKAWRAKTEKLLAPYQEIIYYLQAALTWLQPADGAVIVVGANAALWLLCSISSLSITTFVGFGVMIYASTAIVKYRVSVPWAKLLKSQYRPDSETIAKEAKLLTFSDIAHYAAHYSYFAVEKYEQLRKFRHANPTRYCAEVCVLAALIAALGETVPTFWLYLLPLNAILISPMLYHRGHLAKIQAQFDTAVKPKLLPLLAQAHSAAEKVSALLDQRLAPPSGVVSTDVAHIHKE